MTYPIVLNPDDSGGYVVYVPDFSINTEGNSLMEAIKMAADAVALAMLDMAADGKELPVPSRIEAVAKEYGADILVAESDGSVLDIKGCVVTSVTIDPTPSVMEAVAKERNAK